MTQRGYLLTAAQCWRGHNTKRDSLQCSIAPKTAGPPSRVAVKGQHARSLRFLDSGNEERHSQEEFLTRDTEKQRYPREGCLTPCQCHYLQWSRADSSSQSSHMHPSESYFLLLGSLFELIILFIWLNQTCHDACSLLCYHLIMFS